MNFKLKPKKIISWNYSYLITLPPEWIRNHEIGKGCYVDIEVNEDNNLIIKPKKEGTNEIKQTS